MCVMCVFMRLGMCRTLLSSLTIHSMEVVPSPQLSTHLSSALQLLHSMLQAHPSNLRKRWHIPSLIKKVLVTHATDTSTHIKSQYVSLEDIRILRNYIQHHNVAL